MKYVLLLAALFMVACASISKNEPLYSAYSKYKSEANKENIRELSSTYFSAESLEGKNIGNPELQDQLLFKDYMVTTRNHFERIINDTQGCLTVNGFDKKKEPLEFNIEYLRVTGKWKINAIDIYLANSEHDFRNVGTCPYEYIN